MLNYYQIKQSIEIYVNSHNTKNTIYHNFSKHVEWIKSIWSDRTKSRCSNWKFKSYERNTQRFSRRKNFEDSIFISTKLVQYFNSTIISTYLKSRPLTSKWQFKRYVCIIITWYTIALKTLLLAMPFNKIKKERIIIR